MGTTCLPSKATMQEAADPSGEGRQPPSPPASRLPAQLAAADRSLPFSAEGGGSCCGFLHPETPLLLSGSLL